MAKVKNYRSSIPKDARERVIATFLSGPQKYKAKYLRNGKVVGIRLFHESGELEHECPIKDGVTHGIVYRSDVPGKLLSAESYFNGMPHGVAKQWSDDEKLMGTYTMRHGTGLDLWWCAYGPRGSPYLSEARYVKNGKWHGSEWWLNPDQKSICEERHFQRDQMHGIERTWNQQGSLRRGYPRYWVNDQRVTKRQYLRECAKDTTLPPFRQSDNRPRRRFSAEVGVQLSVSRR
jgi:antitoxin component YwqK of YwqJK toxin-antitoxin module